jgi:hypothetical protein
LSSPRQPKPRRPERPPRPREPAPKAHAAAREGSAPDIRFDYGPVGRETLAAISDEVADMAIAIAARAPCTSAPEIALDETPAGRDTVTAIAREVATHAATAVRPRLTTLDYSSRPRAGDAADSGAQPREPSRETIDALARAMAGSEAEPGPAEQVLEISEMVTFVVRGTDLTQLATEEGRRRFVEERLMRRLPVQSLDQVMRVDVTPWTVRGTLIVRVWCRLDD